MTRCGVVDCGATAADGAHLFRTGKADIPWVCKKHFNDVEIDPRLRELHERWTPALERLGQKAREIPVEGEGK